MMRLLTPSLTWSETVSDYFARLSKERLLGPVGDTYLEYLKNPSNLKASRIKRINNVIQITQ